MEENHKTTSALQQTHLKLVSSVTSLTSIMRVQSDLLYRNYRMSQSGVTSAGKNLKYSKPFTHAIGQCASMHHAQIIFDKNWHSQYFKHKQ